MSELFVIYLALCSFFETMESIVRSAMPVFHKLLEFLEAQASESSSSSPTGTIYMTTEIVEDNDIVLTAEEWGHFMSLLMTCRRNLENSCGIYVDRRHLNTREVTYQKNSTRQNLINWLREICLHQIQNREHYPYLMR